MTSDWRDGFFYQMAAAQAAHHCFQGTSFGALAPFPSGLARRTDGIRLDRRTCQNGNFGLGDRPVTDDMSEFIYRDDRGVEKRFQFLGWKDDGSEFYATDPIGQPVVFTPRPAYTQSIDTGEPYRFPKDVVPREIIPWSLESALTDQVRLAIREWAAAKLAVVDALPLDRLFPFETMRPAARPHTAAEIEEAKRSYRDDIKGFLAQMCRRPAELLIDRDPHGDMLDDILASRWGEALCEPWNQARSFRRRWRAARYGSHPPDCDEGTVSDFERVQYLLRAADGDEYHLRDCSIRRQLSPKEAKDFTLLAGVHSPGPFAAIGAEDEGAAGSITTAGQGPAASRPPGTNSQQRPETPTLNRMIFRGAKRWDIEFDGHEVFCALDKGFARELAYVLKHPHRTFHVLEVQWALAMPVASLKATNEATALESGLSARSGTHGLETKSLSADQYQKVRAQLRERLETARANGDTASVEAAEDRLERLERYQSESRHPQADMAKRCMDRFRVARRRFEAGLAKDRQPGGEAFLAHLTECLTLTRCKIHYHPPGGHTWED